MAKTPSTMLSAGQSAPLLQLNDVLDKSIDTAEIEQRYLLLAFMRYSGCPWCNLAIHRLSLEYETFLEANCEVVAFMQSSQQNILQNIHNRHKIVPKFSIVADPTGIYYNQFGVPRSVKAFARSITKIPQWVHSVRDHGFKQSTMDGSLFTVPAYFLIDTRTGKIVKADYDTSFYDHETFINLYESILFEPY